MSHHWEVWSVSPPVLLAVAAALMWFVRRWWRLRRAGDAAATVPRAIAFVAGLDILLLALISPLDHIGHHYLLSAHMLQHVLIGDVAPVLLVIGFAGPPASIRLPRPAVAFAAWSAVTAGWYVPAAYDLALSNAAVHWAMQLSIFVTGLGVWAYITGLASSARMTLARRAGYALGLLAAGMVVSEVLFLRDPMYSVYLDQTDRLLGLSPAADQVRASLIMTAEGMITLGMAATLLMWSHADRVVAERDEPPAPVPGPRAEVS